MPNKINLVFDYHCCIHHTEWAQYFFQNYITTVLFRISFRREQIFNKFVLNDVYKGRFIGWGRRIRGKPFTNYSPKSMIPILGRPVIDHIVRFVSKFTCVSEILVVCEKDSFGSQIMNYFEGKDRLFQKKISFIEDRKNGTGGALLLCRKYLETESHFLVWYADNLCALDVHDLEQKFFTLQTEKGNDTIKYIVITRSSRVEETGRVFIRKRLLDNLYNASNFVEKL